MKKLSQEEVTSKLRQGHFQRGPELERLSDPLIDTPMLVTLEQLRPYEHNPRFIRNPLFDDIKASIRERGLDQPPQITRRPGETNFIIRNGGNTRLAILGELWQETHDERFFRIHCLFRPWSDEITTLLGHLAESDLHGQLTFIERALAVAKIKNMLEPEGAALSQRELARRLAAGGYPISQSHISRMLDALEYLLPAIPQILYAGLGKPQIERLMALRSQAERTWNRYPTAAVAFAEFWLDTLGNFDTEPDSFDLEQIQAELLERMSRLLGQSYRMLALELSDPQRVITPPSDVVTPSKSSPLREPKEAAAGPASQDPAPVAPRSQSTTPAFASESNTVSSHSDSTQMEQQTPPETNVTTAVSPPSRVQQIREQINYQTTTEVALTDEASATDDVWTIAPTLDTQRMRASYNAQAGQWWSASGGGPTTNFDLDQVG